MKNTREEDPSIIRDIFSPNGQESSRAVIQNFACPLSKMEEDNDASRQFLRGASSELDLRVGSTIPTERLLSDRRHGLFCNRRFTGFDRRGEKKKRKKEKKLSQHGNLIWFCYKYPFLHFPFLFIY